MTAEKKQVSRKAAKLAKKTPALMGSRREGVA
jgi:hypothetical protein